MKHVNQWSGVRPSGPWRWLGVVAGTGLVDCAALLSGWWWMTIVVAFVGALAFRGGAALVALVVGGLLGWTGALVIQSGAEIGSLADLVGVVATGESGQVWLALVATAVVALLLTLSGAWLGGAVRRLTAQLGVEPEPVVAP
jgi:hypothetical protein